MNIEPSLRKWLERSDEDFFKEFSSLPRRKLELGKLRNQRAGWLLGLVGSLFIAIYGSLYNIVGHGNDALSLWANIQYNLQPQFFFATLHPLIYFQLFFLVAFGIKFKDTDSKIKMLLLFEKTQSKE